MHHQISSSNELRPGRHIYVVGLLLAGTASDLMEAAHEWPSDVEKEANARSKDPS